MTPYAGRFKLDLFIVHCVIGYYLIMICTQGGLTLCLELDRIVGYACILGSHSLDTYFKWTSIVKETYLLKKKKKIVQHICVCVCNGWKMWK